MVNHGARCRVSNLLGDGGAQVVEQRAVLLAEGRGLGLSLLRRLLGGCGLGLRARELGLGRGALDGLGLGLSAPGLGGPLALAEAHVGLGGQHGRAIEPRVGVAAGVQHGVHAVGTDDEPRAELVRGRGVARADGGDARGARLVGRRATGRRGRAGSGDHVEVVAGSSSDDVRLSLSDPEVTLGLGADAPGVGLGLHDRREGAGRHELLEETSVALLPVLVDGEAAGRLLGRRCGRDHRGGGLTGDRDFREGGAGGEGESDEQGHFGLQEKGHV